jgi:hypothetical protein|nr:MAG TPA: structural protein [Caudoviricetes sp.]
MFMTQMETAKRTKLFLAQWGLKQKFVAKTCKIPETIFSEFINGKAALNSAQHERVSAYIEDYERRNG